MRSERKSAPLFFWSEKKTVYWAIISPNPLGANVGMKRRAQPHTYAWIWHRELRGWAQKRWLIMFAVCHIKRCAEHGVAVTVPASSHCFPPLSGLDIRLLASFNFPLRQSCSLPVWLSCWDPRSLIQQLSALSPRLTRSFGILGIDNKTVPGMANAA